MSAYTCPHCKQPIYDDEALFCIFCGESLNRSVGFMGRLRYPKHRIVFIIVILAILAAFVLLMGFSS